MVEWAPYAVTAYPALLGAIVVILVYRKRMTERADGSPERARPDDELLDRIALA